MAYQKGDPVFDKLTKLSMAAMAEAPQELLNMLSGNGPSVELIERFLKDKMENLTMEEKMHLFAVHSKEDPTETEQLRKCIKQLQKAKSAEAVRGPLTQLAEMVVHEAQSRAAADAGAISLVRNLAKDPPDPNLLPLLCYTLAELSFPGPNQTRMIKEGLIDDLPPLTEEGNIEINFHLCRLMGNFMPHASGVNGILEHPELLNLLVDMIGRNELKKIPAPMLGKMVLTEMHIGAGAARPILMGFDNPQLEKELIKRGLIEACVPVYLHLARSKPSGKDNSYLILYSQLIGTLGRNGYFSGHPDELEIQKLYNGFHKAEEKRRGKKEEKYTKEYVDFAKSNEPGVDDGEVTNPEDVDKPKCSWRLCNVRATTEAPLLVCSKCKLARYCGREHQMLDWKEGHKRRCAVEIPVTPETAPKSTSQKRETTKTGGVGAEKKPTSAAPQNAPKETQKEKENKVPLSQPVEQQKQKEKEKEKVEEVKKESAKHPAPPVPVGNGIYDLD